MAAKTKTKSNTDTKYRKKSKRKRPGVYSKKRSSKLKSSKNYLKRYRGQGKWKNQNSNDWSKKKLKMF